MNKQLLTLEQAQTQELELLDPLLFRSTKNAQQAVKLMVSMSGYTDDAIASGVKKPRETINRFLNGNGGLDPNSLEALINQSGNVYLLQYLANKFGFDLVSRNAIQSKRDELMAQMAELDAMQGVRQAA